MIIKRFAYKFNKSVYLCPCAIVISIIVRVVLQLGLPLEFRPEFNVDDYLYFTYARNILNGDWLGASYDIYTLNKTPGYAIFLAVLKFFNIPYALGLILCYSLASYVFFIAINKIAKNKCLSYIFFVYVLFSPIMFEISVAQRTYRMAIVPFLILLSASAYLAVYAERDKGWKTILPWCILAGVSYAGFYISREDSIWFSCFVFGATFILTVLLFNKFKSFKKIYKSLLCLMIPIVLCALTVTTIKCINYSKYGIFAMTDFNETYFADMGKLMLKIEPEEEKENVSVTHDTIKKMYEISPTFAELEERLEGYYYPEMDSFDSVGESNEIERDYIIWAIRWAAGDIGVYDAGAVNTDNFYKAVYEDIKAALEDGRLRENDKLVLSNLARPINLKEDVDDILGFSATLFGDLVTYSVYGANFAYYAESTAELELMAEMASTVPVYAPYIDYYKGNINIANIIIMLASIIALPATIAVLIEYIYELTDNLIRLKKHKKTDFGAWLVKTGILLTIAANIVMVSCNYYIAGNGGYSRCFYTAGVIPLWQIFVALSVCEITKYWRQYKALKFTPPTQPPI